MIIIGISVSITPNTTPTIIKRIIDVTITTAMLDDCTSLVSSPDPTSKEGKRV